MRTAGKPFLTLTAADLMSDPVEVIPQEMSLPAAAHLLSQARIRGAPVVDAEGRCVGVLSTTDFVRWAGRRPHIPPGGDCLPWTCSFLLKSQAPNGQEDTLCTLPAGACSFQVPRREPDGTDVLRCNQPHCVCADWQVVDVEANPTGEVRQHMTPDLATAEPDTLIWDLARLMMDAQVHRLFVLDSERRPLGIVTSTDILAAVAYLKL